MDGNSLRIALRTLAKHRGFTAVASLSIAVAVALNTTMYSALDKLIDPQINARDPQHVYSIRFFPGPHGRSLHPSVIQDALKDGIPELEAVSGMDNRSAAAGAGVMSPGVLTEANGRHVRAEPVVVQPNFFEFLGSVAVIGRTFTAADAGSATAVISDRLATRLFAGESPVGRTIMVHGVELGVIGVVRRTQVFAPLSYDLWMLAKAEERPVPISMLRFTRQLEPYGLRKQLDLAAHRLALAAGDPPGTTAFGGGTFAAAERRLSTFDAAMVGAVLAVLLVACANLANLQLARGLARSRELALRSAIGASRSQLVRQLLLEALLIALIGLAVGVVLTLWGIDVVRSTIPTSLDMYAVEPQASWRIFLFAAGVALVSLFLIGLLPALRVSRVDPGTMLKSGAGTGANREHRKRYGVLVIAQIAFALPVLIASVVLLKSAWLYGSHDYLVKEMFGFDPSPIVVATVPYQVRSGGAIRLADVASELTAIARQVEGVTEAAVMARAGAEGSRVTVDDENGVLRDEAAYAWTARLVSPGFLRVFGRSMARGRDFAESEFDGNSVILDDRTVRFLWGNRDPIGRAVKLGGAQSQAPWLRVAGVVGDQRDSNAIRRWDPDANFRLNEVYRVITPADTLVRRNNRAQRLVDPVTGQWSSVNTVRVELFARVRGNTDLAAVRLQRALRTRTGGVEPLVLPMLSSTGMDFFRSRAEFAGALFGTFAFVGLALVGIGVYGIVAHSVAERRRELAVRISLGATARDVLRAVLREGVVLILAGLAVGLLLAKYGIWMLPLAEGQFMTDSLLYALLAALLSGLAAAAAFAPALRATRIDPVDALRHE